MCIKDDILEKGWECSACMTELCPVLVQRVRRNSAVTSPWRRPKRLNRGTNKSASFWNSTRRRSSSAWRYSCLVSRLDQPSWRSPYLSHLNVILPNSNSIYVPLRLRLCKRVEILSMLTVELKGSKEVAIWFRCTFSRIWIVFYSNV